MDLILLQHKQNVLLVKQHQLEIKGVIVIVSNGKIQSMMPSDVKLNVHFLEYDEFLENSEESSQKKKGDMLEGDLSIELVSSSKK